MICHEFRAPLTSTLMILETMINSHKIQDSTRCSLYIIVSQINLLLSLINDMLDARLIEENKF